MAICGGVCGGGGGRGQIWKETNITFLLLLLLWMYVLYMYILTYSCLRLKFKKGSEKNTLQSEIWGGGGGGGKKKNDVTYLVFDGLSLERMYFVQYNTNDLQVPMNAENVIKCFLFHLLCKHN